MTSSSAPSSTLATSRLQPSSAASKASFVWEIWRQRFSPTTCLLSPIDTMWSIGIYTGDSPYRLKPATHNPVLTRADVTDRSATFVADPFMIRHKNLWFMFFEVMTNTDRGEIAFATSE